MSRRSSNFDVAGLVGEWDPQRSVLHVLVLLGVVFFLFPIESGIVTAFKTTEAVARTLPFLPPAPDGFTLEKVQFAVERLSGAFVNSIAMSLVATGVNVLIASMAAYGLTMVKWRGQVAVLSLFIVGIFVPYQAVLVPLARFWTNIFPLDEMVSWLTVLPLFQDHHLHLVPLTVTHIAYGIPICTLLYRSYYRSLPPSLVEAGKVDGASITRIYREIILPISKPMIGVVFIYQFTMIYNEFLFSFTLLPGVDSPAATVTLIIPAIGSSTSGIDFGLRMAAAFLAAIPTLVIYVAFAEQFAKGLETESG